MPQLDPTSFASQIFWLVITFVTLYVVLSRLVLPPLQELLVRRQQTVAGDIEEAQQLKLQAEKARQEYERMLADARARAQQVMLDAERMHKEKAETACRAMDQEVARKIEQATREIDARKAELIAALQPAAGELASLIVEKLTNRSPGDDQVTRILGALAKAGGR